MKTALIIHGWPNHIEKDHPLYGLFTKLGYEVYAPYLFSGRYSYDTVKEKILKNLKKKPEIIAGISLGGSIAQKLAIEYPDSKLILLNSGPYLDPDNRFLFNALYYLRLSHLVFLSIKFIPRPLLMFLYRLVLPIMKKNYKDYKPHMDKNINNIKKIKYNTFKDVIRYGFNFNNESILNSIKNKTLIVCGDGDIVMPSRLSKIMNKKIKDSKLLIFNTKHHNLYNNESIKEIKKFVK